MKNIQYTAREYSVYLTHLVFGEDRFIAIYGTRKEAEEMADKLNDALDYFRKLSAQTDELYKEITTAGNKRCAVADCKEPVTGIGAFCRAHEDY